MFSFFKTNKLSKEELLALKLTEISVALTESNQSNVNAITWITQTLYTNHLSFAHQYLSNNETTKTQTNANTNDM